MGREEEEEGKRGGGEKRRLEGSIPLCRSCSQLVARSQPVHPTGRRRREKPPSLHPDMVIVNSFGEVGCWVGSLLLGTSVSLQLPFYLGQHALHIVCI